MLQKKSKDVKFIIYQALYIFVVCVVAIKGANLDLAQVVEDDGKPKVVMTPEEMDSIQQRLQYSVIVDTNHFVVVPKELLAENEKLQQIVQNMPRIDLNQYVLKSEVPKIEEKVEDKIEDTKVKDEILVGSLTLYQYHDNVINNRGNIPLVVQGVTIPPHSSKTVRLGGESSIVLQSGSVSKTIGVLENKKPQISINRMTTMNEETRVSTLQSVTCFRVTINDDFVEQLDVKFSGGITVSQRDASTFDVRLNFFGSRQAFDTYTDNRESPYSVGFTVTVTDRIAGHKQTGQNSFIFGEW